MSSTPARGECTLPRALVLPGAMDPKLRCEHDEDNNGLDDEMEELLGRCFAPRLRFDSAVGLEEAPTKTYFNALATSPEGEDGGVDVTLHYGLAWPRDNGFTQMSNSRCSEDAATQCTAVATNWHLWNAALYAACLPVYRNTCAIGCRLDNAHTGDFQSLSIEVKVVPGVDRWFATVGMMQAGTPKAGNDVVGAPNGDRWDLFLSPGKHHFYRGPRADRTYPIDLTLTGSGSVLHLLQEQFGVDTLDCDDPHDGAGPSLQITELHHVPANGGAGDRVGEGWANLCSRDVRQLPGVPAVHLPAPTTSLPGCDYFQSSFCDGPVEVAGAATTMSYSPGMFDDIDHDTKPNHVDLCPTLAGSGELPDDDGDGLPNQCDADPGHENKYVGRGGTRVDGVAVKGTVAKVTAARPLVTPPSYRGGYSDFDGDNVADGADLCPSHVGATTDVNVDGEWTAADWNRWAHLLNLTSVDPGFAKELTRQTGYLHRGNACDPYPVTKTRASRDAGGLDQGPSPFCRGQIEVELGASEIPIETVATVGTSANAQPSAAPRVFAHRAYRCDCEGDVGCLDNPFHACFRGRMTRPPGAAEWAGWMPTHSPGCALDSENHCASTPLALTPGASKTVRSLWAWLDELESRPAQVRPDSIVDVMDGGTPARASVDSFAIRTMFDEGESLKFPPGVGLFWDQQRSLYGEPDTGADGSALHLNLLASDENRRTRSSVAATLVQPHSEFTRQIDTGNCQPFTKGTFAQVIAKVKHPDPIDEVTFPVEVFTLPGGLDAVRLRSPTDNVTRAVASDGLPDWMGQPGALGALPSDPGPAPAPGGAGWSRAPRGVPNLVWVEIGTTQASRWALVRPVTVGPETVSYSLVFEGEAPFGLSRAARVVTDQLRERVVVVDPSVGLVAAWDQVRSAWSRHEVPAARRERAALALDGATLFVAGGGTDESLSLSGLTLIDVFDGTASTRPGLPARRDALLSLAGDDHTLVFAGGLDAAGRAHDDVWTLDFARPAALPLKLASDTAGGRLVAGEALLDVTVKTPRVRVMALANGLPDHRERGEGGWRSLDVVTAPACAADDEFGGTLCELAGATPWSSPGRVSCGTSDAPHECAGAPGDVRARRRLGRDVVDVDVTAETVWSLRRRSVERRRLARGLADVSVERVELDSAAHALSASDEGVMIATDRGFSFLAPGAAQARSVEVCGRGVSVARLSPGVWVGATTLGVAVIGAADGAPVVWAEGALSLRDESDEDSLELSSTPRGARCAPRPPRGCGEEPGEVAVVALGPSEFLLRRAGRVARVRRAEGGFTVIAWARVPLGQGLRFDPIGRRAYSDGRHGATVLDLRGQQLEVRRSDIDLGAWVRRRDSGWLSARVEDGAVRVAEVVR